jgi:hypothetical protein
MLCRLRDSCTVGLSIYLSIIPNVLYHPRCLGRGGFPILLPRGSHNLPGVSSPHNSRFRFLSLKVYKR